MDPSPACHLPAAPAHDPAACVLGALECERLTQLRSYRILDTPRDVVFDRFATQAARLLDAPVAGISFLDQDRQWFKARLGPDLPAQSRSLAFCAQTILSDEILLIPDTVRDARTAGHRLVIGPPYVRFYVGAPLVVAAGSRIGSLCVLDFQPRSVTSGQIAALGQLAIGVVAALEARKARLEGRHRALDS